MSNALFPDDVVLDDTAERLMFMVGDICLYFDESYNHSPDPLVYTVAGYLSTDVQWRKFRKKWRRILEAEGLDHFHMVDFQACKPPYGSWSRDKRKEYLWTIAERRLFWCRMMTLGSGVTALGSVTFRPHQLRLTTVRLLEQLHSPMQENLAAN